MMNSLLSQPSGVIRLFVIKQIDDTGQLSPSRYTALPVPDSSTGWSKGGLFSRILRL